MLKHTVKTIRDEAVMKLIKEYPKDCKNYLAFASSQRDTWLLAEAEAWKKL